jgi:hypothetical protein
MELENEKIKYLQAEQNLKTIHISLSQLQEGISNLQKTKSSANINSEKIRSIILPKPCNFLNS